MTSSERGASVRFPPPLIFLLSLLTGVALRLAGLPASVPLARPLRISIGAVVLGMGLGLVVTARVRFFRTGQVPAPWTPSPSLILEGPYRFTRNPMYLGVTLVQIAAGVLLDDSWIALLAPLSLLVVHFIAVRPEERYLSSRFGAAYEQYRARPQVPLR